MSRVILANTGSAAMAPSAHALSDELLRTNAAAAKRLLWLANGNDILITPTPVTKEFLNYVNSLTGRSNITLLSTSSTPTMRPLPISEKDIAPGSAFSSTLRLMASGTQLSCLEPYIADEVSISIARALGHLPVRFSDENVRVSPVATRLLNDKEKFRQFAPDLGVPIANGRNCASTQQLVDTVCKVLSDCESAILKMARHAGGDGNIVVSTSAARSSQGATRSVAAAKIDVATLRETVHELGLSPTVEEPVIVEEYSENESSMGVHFDVRRDSVDLVGVASILFNPGYGGAYWSSALLDQLPGDVLSWCKSLGNYAQEIGYFGPLSVDIVRAKEIGFFACEVNGRHGGFSSIRAVSKALGLEFDIKNGSRVALSRNCISIALRFPDLIDLLQRRQLHYRPADRRGAIVMVEGHQDAGPYDFVIFGGDLEELQAIERELAQLSHTRN
ncbi:peptide ligase PGM1-related protein [Bradyrhizobium pachyrhizi]|uniref:preATP grasp domain-containing protein n=1 Tax=Bradyrhizobium pachyrhizi TaxID=280333 RepID=UPI000A6E50D3|nr:peptide ligase PGM1-related protein [Bradyrhizobium pachyrhizi]